MNRLLSFALLCGLVFACQNPSAANPVAATPPASATLVSDDGSVVRVGLEIARNPRARELGLMNRTSLAALSGMLFVFDRPAKQTFWMKNTLIPLDMVFITAERKIVGIVENAEPMTLTGRGVATPAQYVLELNGGFCATHHIHVGAMVGLENIGPPATD